MNNIVIFLLYPVSYNKPCLERQILFQFTIWLKVVLNNKLKKKSSTSAEDLAVLKNFYL
jgi:hypothetical protein